MTPVIQNRLMEDDDLRYERQEKCEHNPQPVAGMDQIMECTRCGRIFSKHEADMMTSRVKSDADKPN